jgi:hypothetical protein
VADCEDGCPKNPLKTGPGICGCDQLDIDSDGDGKPDCQDTCPNDPEKTAPGVCGCGVPDVDVDADGTMDCKESVLPSPSPTASESPTPSPTSSPTPRDITKIKPTTAEITRLSSRAFEVTMSPMGLSPAKRIRYHVQLRRTVGDRTFVTDRTVRTANFILEDLLSGQYKLRYWLVLRGESSKASRWSLPFRAR